MEKLWDDILEVYAMPQPQRHFIGSVVTQPIPDAPERAQKFMLIDGQQRMTTLLLLLAVIRFHANEQQDQESLSGEITDTCLHNIYVSNQDEQFKLRPTLADREAFEAAMKGEIPDKSSQIGEAWHYFSGKVEGNDPEDKPIVLRQLKERVTLYLDLVSIRLEQGDSPNRIFESLNNTGMRLEAADLIRNYIFMHIPDEHQQDQAYERLWFPLQETLGDSIDDFFWRYSMKDGKLTRWDDIFDDTRDELEKHPDEDVVPALEDFFKFSGHYMRIKYPEQNETSEVIKVQTTRLNDWEVEVSYLFLLAIFDQYTCGQIPLPDLVQVLQMVESFVVRRTICGVPTNRLRRIFAGMAGQYDLTDIVESCRTYLLTNQWPDDDEFHQKLVSYRLYNPARLRRTRLILDSLERSFNHKESPEMHDNISIEHIMPQTLNDEWEDMLGSDAKRVHSQWLDSIGNLTLTGYNPNLGNRPFGKKLELLKGSKFELTSDAENGVLGVDVWNEGSIKERANRLANRALRIWDR